MLVNRVQRNLRRLKPWAARHDVACYRIYERDIPEIPLAVDWYEGRLHVAEFERPHDRTSDEHEEWLDALMSALCESLEVDESQAWLKRRKRQRGLAQYERFASQGAIFDAPEQGLLFEVNLSDYLDTGLFLDHRITRSMVRERAQDKSVLNLFAYTGSFSVYAGAGGARVVTTVDASNTYIDWARRNWKLNHLQASKAEWIKEDAASFARDADAGGRRWDLIVCDPPTFSNSHSRARDFDIQRDHSAMLGRLMRLLKPDGELFFSTNARQFRLDPELEYEFRCRDITDKTLPPDFRNQKIHRCWTLRHAGAAGEHA
jgi:23S rRNA (cytosine1962-C5)-methyltransferase